MKDTTALLLALILLLIIALLLLAVPANVSAWYPTEDYVLYLPMVRNGSIPTPTPRPTPTFESPSFCDVYPTNFWCTDPPVPFGTPPIPAPTMNPQETAIPYPLPELTSVLPVISCIGDPLCDGEKP